MLRTPPRFTTPTPLDFFAPYELRPTVDSVTGYSLSRFSPGIALATPCNLRHYTLVEFNTRWASLNATRQKSMKRVRNLPLPTIHSGVIKLTESVVTETEVFHGLTFHHLGLILSAVFGLIAVVISLYLIFQHATHYLKPWEQKQYALGFLYS